MNTNFNMPSSDDDNTCATCLYRYEHCQCMAVFDAGPVLWPQHLVDELLGDQVFVYFEPLSELVLAQAVL